MGSFGTDYLYTLNRSCPEPEGFKKYASFILDFAHLRACASLFKHSCCLGNFHGGSPVMMGIAYTNSVDTLTVRYMSHSMVLMSITMPYWLTLPFFPQEHDAICANNNFMLGFINSFRGKASSHPETHAPSSCPKFPDMHSMGGGRCRVNCAQTLLGLREWWNYPKMRLISPMFKLLCQYLMKIFMPRAGSKISWPRDGTSI